VPVVAEGKKLLVAQSQGAFHTMLNTCSHAEAPLECGRVRAGWIACPVHGARFRLDTGEAINPPATDPIVIFPTRVVGGWVEADL
jgi:nitrite reductase/ring-hydroxylating ferredoxin subunit